MKEYTEDDLRKAFYKGREQASLPDEKGTIMFIRPTFNGYLRELNGNEDPHKNWKIRCDSLINDKDYDLENWKAHNKLRELQKKYIKELEQIVVNKNDLLPDDSSSFICGELIRHNFSLCKIGRCITCERLNEKQDLK